MTTAEWDTFRDAKFVGEFAGQASDFYAWLRTRGLCYLDYPVTYVEENLFVEWSRTWRRGRHTEQLDRSRRRKFGPGKYWAPTAGGVFLNKQFVKGWRGINPARP